MVQSSWGGRIAGFGENIQKRLNCVFALGVDLLRLIRNCVAIAIQSQQGEIMSASATGKSVLACSNHGPTRLERSALLGAVLSAAIIPAAAHADLLDEDAGSGRAPIVVTGSRIEAANPNGEEFGPDRFAKRVLSGIHLPAKQMIDHVRKGVADFTERKFLDDDGTLFVVKAL